MGRELSIENRSRDAVAQGEVVPADDTVAEGSAIGYRGRLDGGTCKEVAGGSVHGRQDGVRLNTHDRLSEAGRLWLGGGMSGDP
jgi:hypothetical protein